MNSRANWGRPMTMMSRRKAFRPSSAAPIALEVLRARRSVTLKKPGVGNCHRRLQRGDNILETNPGFVLQSDDIVFVGGAAMR